MIRDIVINDPDADRDYHCQVRFQCCEEIGGPNAVNCDVDGIVLENVVVWLNKCGMEVTIDYNHRRSWESEIMRRYMDEIRRQCEIIWREERIGAA